MTPLDLERIRTDSKQQYLIGHAVPQGVSVLLCDIRDLLREVDRQGLIIARLRETLELEKMVAEFDTFC